MATINTIERKALSTTNAKGELTVTVNGNKYSFSPPKGKDLVTMERTLKNGGTDLEALTALMGGVSLDGHEQEYFLDLPMKELAALAQEINQFFRA